MPNAKAKALMGKLQKEFGEELIMPASQIRVGDQVPSGSVGLDFATGFGGFPSNRVVEIFGKEGTGKTTLALVTMANALKRNPDRLGMFLDVEHKMTKDWLIKIVGEEFATERIFYVQPPHIEKATNIYRAGVETGQFCCAILDSIGGAPTIRRNEDAEISGMGGNSLGVTEFANVSKTHASIHDCLTIGINQVRAVIGSRIPNLTDTPGGKAWRHAAILRIELVRGKDTDTIRVPGEEKPVPVGYTVYARVKKNQVGPEGRTAMYWFYNVETPEHDFGVDYLDEIARLGLVTRVFTRTSATSSWYTHPLFPEDAKGERKVNGINGIKEVVRAEEKLRDALTTEIVARAREHAGSVAPMTNPDDELDVAQISPFLLSGGVT